MVAFADQFTGYGNLVIVDHGERAFSLYGYLSAIQVAQGERVEAQAPLGRSGRNPTVTRRSTSSSASTASRSIPYNGYRKGLHDLQDPHVRAGRLDAGPRVRPRRRPAWARTRRRAPDSRRIQHLRVFDDVVDLVMNNYVGEVKVDKVMEGAMRGLADGLDPDSAYLNPSR